MTDQSPTLSTSPVPTGRGDRVNTARVSLPMTHATAADDVPSSAVNKIDTGGNRVSVSTGGASVDPAEVVPSGVLASLTSPSGGRHVGAISDDCRVHVNGIEMRVSDAISLGALKKTADGYVETDFDAVQSAKAEADAKDRAEAAQSAERLEVEPAAHNMLKNMTHAVREMGANPVQDMAAFLRNPEQIPPSLMQVVRDRGYNSTQILGELRQVGAAIEKAVGDHVRRKGVDDVPAFFDYVKRTNPNALTGASIAALFENNLKPFTELASTYLAGTVARAPGMETFMQRTAYGEVECVTLPNGLTTTLQNARNLGLL